MASQVTPGAMPDKPVRREKKRRGLRRISKSKAAWRALYIVALRDEIARDPLCRKCRKRPATHGHHPNRQQGANILIFYPFCLPCHRGVEDNKNQAREEGWITYT